MKNNFGSELLISCILIALAVLLLNPFQLWMPQEAHMTIIVALVVIFILCVTFIWREKTGDEREVLHRNISGRWAYLAGTTIAVAGVVVQSLQHTLNVWLVLTLVAMVLGKIMGLIYGKIKK